MSLHALAGHMAAKGRGSDSMLVHMTPEEVQSLQVLALKGGGTLTINPDTGLPEANFLKKMLPMIAGAALNFFAPGLGTAVGGMFGMGAAAGTGIAVGGISALATGSLSRGLMAGLGAYGGASLAGSLSGAGAASLGQDAVTSATAELGAGATDAALQEAVATKLGPEGAMGAFKSLPVSEQFSSGLKAAANNPGQFMRNNLGAAYAAMTPMMAADSVQTTTPRQDTGYIRNYTFDPYGQTYSDAGSYPASEYKGMAQGGIVALAAGGLPAKIDQNYVNQLVKEAATQAGGTLSFADASNAARNLGISDDMLRSAASNTGFITGAPASVAGPAAGSDAYNSMVGNFFSNPNITSADVSSAMSTYGLNQADVTNAMRASGLSNAAQFAAFQPDVGVPNTPLGGLAGLSSNINAALGNFRGVEGRAPTRAEAEAAMGLEGYNERDFLRATGMSLDEYFKTQKKPTNIISTTTQIPDGVSGGGNTMLNPNGTITTAPNIPGRPPGGFTGMGQVRDAYTQGGGSLGYANDAPLNMGDFNERFNRQTGDSLAAYEYLMGRGKDGSIPASPRRSVAPELMRPYVEETLRTPENLSAKKFIFDPQTKRLVANPDYIPMSFNSKGERKVGLTSNEVLKGFNALPDKSDDATVFDWMDTNNVTLEQMARAMNISLAEAQRRRDAAAKKKTDADEAAKTPVGDVAANGGLMGMAAGGYAVGGGLGALAGGGSTSQYNLGSYSDGGRLLRGPGDGVSDSIPATIGDKQPARLADGEFVVPARIVSELGNGSTEAGARKLYAMMDRVQKARGKTTGKNRVAANTRSEKFLPA